MTTENIDVVVKSGGTRRVVRDLTDIADAADHSANRVQRLQTQLDRLNTSSFQRQLNAVQNSISGLGQNAYLSQFQSQLQAVTNQLAAMHAQMNQGVGHMNRHAGAANGMIGTLRSLRNVVTATLALLGVRQILEWADAWTQAAGKILIFSRSQEEANAVMGKVYNISQEVRSPLQALAQLYTRLTISSRELGVSQNEMLRFTQLVGKIFTIQGTGAMQARGALLQLSQAMGEGIVRGQEFNSLLENAPLLLTVVAKNLDAAHGSVAQLRRIMLDGKLTSKDFFEALMKGQSEIEEMFKHAPKTFSQGFTVLVNAIEKYVGQINQAYGLSEKFFNLVSVVGNNLDLVAKGILAIGAGVAVAFAPALLTAVLAGLTAIAGAVGTISALLLANPFIVLATAAAAAFLFADNIKIGVDNVTTLQDVFTALGPTLAETWKSGIEGVQVFFGTLFDLASKVFGGFGEYLAQAISNWTKRFSGFYDDVGTGFAGVVRAIAKTTDAIVGLLIGMGVGVIRTLEGMPNAVDQIGKKMFNAVVGSIEGIINTAITGVNKLWAIVGKGSIEAVKFARANVDDNYFKNFGSHIADSIDEGFRIQGNFLLNGVNSVFDKASAIAQSRSKEAFRQAESLAQQLEQKLGTGTTPATGKNKGAQKALNEAARAAQGEIRELLDKYRVGVQEMTELERHKEAMLKASYQLGLMNYAEYTSKLKQMQDDNYQRQKTELEQQRDAIQSKMTELAQKLKAKGMSSLGIQNIMQDLETKLRGVNLQLEKLGNKNTERLAQNLVQALGPAREILDNSQKELTALEANYGQQLENLKLKANQAQLSERELFIQENMLKLLDKYEDKLRSVKSVFNDLLSRGVFDDLTDPAVYKNFQDMLKFMGQIQEAIDKIKKEAPETLSKLFDAQETEKFAKNLNTKLVEAIMNAGKDGGKGMREFIQDELFKKPIRLALEFALKPFSQAISGVVMNAMSSVMGFFTGGGGSFAGNNPSAFVAGGSSALSAGSSLFSMLGAANLGMGSFGAGLATGFSSLMSGNLFGAIGAAGSIGGVGGLGMLAGSLGPIIGGIALLAKVFGGKGETRVGGQYMNTSLVDSPSGGPIENSKIIESIATTMKGIDDTLAMLGSSSRILGFASGLEQSTKGMGFAYARGNLTTGGMFGDWSQPGYMQNRGTMTAEQAVAAYSIELRQATLEAIKAASDIPKTISDLLANVDIETLGENDIQALLTKINEIAMSVKGFREVVDMLPFESLKNRSFDAAAGLIELAGGLDKLTAGLNAYYENFFSEEERRWQTMINIANTLNKGGFSLRAEDVQAAANSPAAKTIFRNLVEAAMAMGPAGDQALAALLSVAGAFAALIPVAEDTSKAVDTVTDAVKDFTELQKAVDDAYRNLMDLRKGELTTLRDTAKYYRDLASSLRTFRDSLKLGDLSPLTPGQKYAEASRQFDDILAAAGRGDKDAQAKIQSAATEFLNASRVYNASSAQYQSDFAKVQAALTIGAAAADSVADTTTRQADLLEKQLDQLGLLNNTARTIADAMQKLAATVGAALAAGLNPGAGPIGALTGGVTGQFVGTPIGDVYASSGGAAYTGGTLYGAQGGSWSVAQIQSLANEALAANQPMQVYNAAKAVGITLAELDAIMGWPSMTAENWANAVGLPVFHQGGVMPYTGLALLQGGEQVLSRAQAWRSSTEAASSSTQDLAALLYRMDALIQEVAELREQQADSVNAQILAFESALEEHARNVASGVSEATAGKAWMQKKRQGAKFE